MIKNKPRVTRSFGLVAALALIAVLLSGGVAHADEGGAKFVAQSRAAGLSADQAVALQAEADKYLAKLGSGATQVAPDTIKMSGLTVHLATPGAKRVMASCPYLNFCAYQYEYFTGTRIDAEKCWIIKYIPWYSLGSWINNQTSGTRATIYYLNGSTWRVAGAYSEQSTGMHWENVDYVDPC